ncbi:MAG: hypothetical protein CBC35_08800 [Planctomycetes bacterium TMED75]|nr:hypothetical protein [Planctomycetaceae bacterium]OUU91774.1 MAG: hypothetical protein CBC35_08800 [Planctomycetes bacterium TMED75]
MNFSSPPRGVLPPGSDGEGPGADWGGRAPRSEDPMSWSLPLARVGRTEFRIHVFFLLFSVVELTRALIAGGDPAISMPLGFFWTAAALLFLWWIVLFHELGHVVIARLIGGGADEVLMWPLGGLAAARAPAGWKASLLVALGGPMVNVLIFVFLGSILYTATDDFTCVFPSVLSTQGLTQGIVLTSHSSLYTTLYIVHWVNALVLVFSCLPSFPLDGARALHAILWGRLGYTRAMAITCRVGFVISILLGVTALLTTEGIYAGYLVALAVFCAFCCVRQFQKMRFTETELETLDRAELAEWNPEEVEDGVVGRIHSEDSGDPAPRRSRENAAVDLILDKIQRHGMSRLTLRERWLLKRASKRRRNR